MCTIVPIVVRYFYCCSITDREDSLEKNPLYFLTLFAYFNVEFQFDSFCFF